MKKLIYSLLILLSFSTSFGQSTLKLDKNLAVNLGPYEGFQYFAKSGDNLYFWGINAKNIIAVSCVNEKGGNVLWTKALDSGKEESRNDGVWMSNDKIYYLRSVLNKGEKKSKGLLDVYDADLNKLENIVLGDESAIGDSRWGHQIQADGRTLVSIKETGMEYSAHSNILWEYNKSDGPSNRNIFVISKEGKVEQTRTIEIDSKNASVFTRYYLSGEDLYVINFSVNKEKQSNIQLIYQAKGSNQSVIAMPANKVVGSDLVQANDGKVYFIANTETSEDGRTLSISELNKATIAWTSTCPINSPSLKSQSDVFDFSHTKMFAATGVVKSGSTMVIGGHFYYYYLAALQGSPAMGRRSALMPFEININEKHESSIDVINALPMLGTTHRSMKAPSAFTTTTSGIAVIAVETDVTKDLSQLNTKSNHTVMVASDGARYIKSTISLDVEGIKEPLQPWDIKQYDTNKFIGVANGKKGQNIIIFEAQ
jgi:hypothetical protein